MTKEKKAEKDPKQDRLLNSAELAITCGLLRQSISARPTTTLRRTDTTAKTIEKRDLGSRLIKWVIVFFLLLTACVVGWEALQLVWGKM